MGIDTLVSSYGAYEEGQAKAASAAYQAQVAKNNAQIARENAGWTEAAGAAKETMQGMKGRATIGAIKVAQAANNVDVNTGSAADVRTAAQELSLLDAMTIRSNTAREAYGYEVGATSDEAQAELLKAESEQAKTAGNIAALSSLLSGASNSAGKAAKLYNAGAF